VVFGTMNLLTGQRLLMARRGQDSLDFGGAASQSGP